MASTQGIPRVQYQRVVHVLPRDATLERVQEVLKTAYPAQQTVSFSYDDAGIGALDDRTAILWYIPAEKRGEYRAFYSEHYPGVKVEFRPNGPPPPPSTRGKWGFHALYSMAAAEEAIRLGARTVTMVDVGTGVKELALKYPKVLFIHRVMSPTGHYPDPADLVSRLAVDANWPENVVCVGINEEDNVPPERGSSFKSTAFIRERFGVDRAIYDELRKRAPAVRYAASIYPPTGKPDEAELMAAMRETYIQAANTLPGFWLDFHNYGRDKSTLWSVNAKGEKEHLFFELRIKWLADAGLDRARARVIYSESGVDQMGTGGVPAVGMTTEEWGRWLERFDALHIEYDLQGLVAGGAFFQLGDDQPAPIGRGPNGRWSGYELWAYREATREFYANTGPDGGSDDVQSLSQHDPRWADLAIGEAPAELIGQAGSLFMCWYMMALRGAPASREGALKLLNGLKQHNGYAGATPNAHGPFDRTWSVAGCCPTGWKPARLVSVSTRWANDSMPRYAIDALIRHLASGNPAWIEVDATPGVPGHRQHYVLGVGVRELEDGSHIRIFDPATWPPRDDEWLEKYQSPKDEGLDLYQRYGKVIYQFGLHDSGMQLLHDDSAAPTIEFRADKSAVRRGEAVTFQWQVGEGVEGVYFFDGQTEQGVAGTDYRAVYPTAKNAYWLKVIAHAGKEYRSDTLSVAIDANGPSKQCRPLIGVHCMNSGDATKAALRAGARATCHMHWDSAVAAADWFDAQGITDYVVIYRHFLDRKVPTAKEMVELLHPGEDPRIYRVGINECESWPDGDRPQGLVSHGKWDTEVALRLRDTGIKYLAGTIARGNPWIVHKDVCEAIREGWSEGFNQGLFGWDHHLYSPTKEHIYREEQEWVNWEAVWAKYGPCPAAKGMPRAVEDAGPYRLAYDEVYDRRSRTMERVPKVDLSSAPRDLGAPGASLTTLVHEYDWYERRWIFLVDLCGFDPFDGGGFFSTETGLDSDVGFPANGVDAAGVARWCERFRDITMQPVTWRGVTAAPKVRGFVIYQAGDTGEWQSFNIHGYLEEVGNLFWRRELI